MNTSKLRDALLKVMNDVFHYEADGNPEKYIVWSEDGQGSTAFADDVMQEQSLSVTVDYYTKDEYDSNFHKIQEVLSEAEISFRLNSIQYEKDTKLNHYEWVVELG